MEYGTLTSLKKVISASMNISIQASGKPCSRAQSIACDFLLKNTLVAVSIWSLINPRNLDDFGIGNNQIVHDFPSAFVLVRTLFEGYINMYYLLVNPRSDEERDFRLFIWERHALLERQKMGKFLGSTHDKLADEKNKIQQLTKKITSSNYFKKLSKPNEKWIRKEKEWTETSVFERADIAEIDRSQYKFIYKFLSNYVHSEAYALMQISSIRSPNTASSFMKIPLQYTEMFLSLTLSVTKSIVPVAQGCIGSDKILCKIIDYSEDLKKCDFKDF